MRRGADDDPAVPSRPQQIIPGPDFRPGGISRTPGASVFYHLGSRVDRLKCRQGHDFDTIRKDREAERSSSGNSITGEQGDMVERIAETGGGRR